MLEFSQCIRISHTRFFSLFYFIFFSVYCLHFILWLRIRVEFFFFFACFICVNVALPVLSFHLPPQMWVFEDENTIFLDAFWGSMRGKVEGIALKAEMERNYLVSMWDEDRNTERAECRRALKDELGEKEGWGRSRKDFWKNSEVWTRRRNLWLSIWWGIYNEEYLTLSMALEQEDIIYIFFIAKMNLQLYFSFIPCDAETITTIENELHEIFFTFSDVWNLILWKKWIKIFKSFENVDSTLLLWAFDLRIIFSLYSSWLMMSRFWVGLNVRVLRTLSVLGFIF